MKEIIHIFWTGYHVSHYISLVQIQHQSITTDPGGNYFPPPTSSSPALPMNPTPVKTTEIVAPTLACPCAICTSSQSASTPRTSRVSFADTSDQLPRRRRMSKPAPFNPRRRPVSGTRRIYASHRTPSAPIQASARVPRSVRGAASGYYPYDPSSSRATGRNFNFPGDPLPYNRSIAQFPDQAVLTEAYWSPVPMAYSPTSSRSTTPGFEAYQDLSFNVLPGSIPYQQESVPLENYV